jgi:hypothetical protein
MGVARLGGSGSGAFFWDSECPELVVFHIEVNDGTVRVHSDDPQSTSACSSGGSHAFRRGATVTGLAVARWTPAPDRVVAPSAIPSHR